MSQLLITLFVILNQFHTNNVTNNDHDIPVTWTKDFVISLSFSGSMDGSSSHVTYTYDSCRYQLVRGMETAKNGVFALTAADRTTILKKLRDLKVNKVRSEISLAPVDDGWSSLLCIGRHCINGGTSAKMSDHDHEIFSVAFAYLEGFAAQKAR